MSYPSSSNPCFLSASPHPEQQSKDVWSCCRLHLKPAQPHAGSCLRPASLCKLAGFKLCQMLVHPEVALRLCLLYTVPASCGPQRLWELLGLTSTPCSSLHASPSSRSLRTCCALYHETCSPRRVFPETALIRLESSPQAISNLKACAWSDLQSRYSLFACSQSFCASCGSNFDPDS